MAEGSGVFEDGLTIHAHLDLILTAAEIFLIGDCDVRPLAFAGGWKVSREMDLFVSDLDSWVGGIGDEFPRKGLVPATRGSKERYSLPFVGSSKEPPSIPVLGNHVTLAVTAAGRGASTPRSSVFPSSG